MEKSESYLIEWDLVSDHDTELENGISQEKSTIVELENSCVASGKVITDSNCVTPVFDHGLKVVTVIVSEMIDSVTKQMTDTDVTASAMHEIIDNVEPYSTANVTEENCCKADSKGNIEDMGGDIFKIKTEQNATTEVPNAANQCVETIHCDVDKIDEKIETESINDHIEDHIVKDSSVEYTQVELYERSSVPDWFWNLLKILNFDEQENVATKSFYSDIDITDENAASEGFSSDIDIIDENIEENVPSSFLHPLSLSINYSVDASSVRPKTSTTENSNLLSEVSGKSQYEDRNERKRKNIQLSSQRHYHRNSVINFFAGILAFLCNMTAVKFSILGGVLLCLYVTIVFNQTNIFAITEEENAVSQMKKMFDELKHNNKILKDQMLSQMKMKVFSSFSHQVKELKEENSKLTKRLTQIQNSLEEQKISQKTFEKREADHMALFKKEINSLKENIKLLKYDNKDLQKQLVQMRYENYSESTMYTTDDKSREQKDEIKADATSSTEDIMLDINQGFFWQITDLFGLYPFYNLYCRIGNFYYSLYIDSVHSLQCILSNEFCKFVADFFSVQEKVKNGLQFFLCSVCKSINIVSNNIMSFF